MIKNMLAPAFNLIVFGLAAFCIGHDRPIYVFLSIGFAVIAFLTLCSLGNKIFMACLNGRFYIPKNSRYCRPLLKGLGVHGHIRNYTLIFELESDFWESPGKGHLKIAGFGLGWNHHKNSIRISIKPLNEVDMYECYVYYYDKIKSDKWQACWLFDFKSNQRIIVPLYLDYNNSQIVFIPGITGQITIPYDFDYKPRWGFMLRPHMPGTIKASVQHDFCITQKIE